MAADAAVSPGTLQFGRRGIGILRRQRGEALCPRRDGCADNRSRSAVLVSVPRTSDSVGHVICRSSDGN